MNFDSRRNNIDALRLILALLVLFSHSYPLATGTEEQEPLHRLTGGQLTLGALAVDCFFILSGYLISQSWMSSRSSRSFLGKRFRRIYPAYVVAGAVCVWVVVPLASPAGGAVYSLQTVFDNGWRFLTLRRKFQVPETFLSNPVPNALNGSLWSISFEFWCYIGIFLLGITTALRYRKLILGLFLALVAAHFIFEWNDLSPGGKILGVIFGHPRLWARMAPLYLAGVVAYLFRTSIPLRTGLAIAALAAFFLAARIPCGMAVAMPTVGAYLLLYVAFHRKVTWHRAAAYGDFSYGIYLYAFPIQQLIMYFIGHVISPFLLFALSLAPTVFAGVLSWYTIERWFLLRPKRKTQSAPPAFPHLSFGVQET